MSNIMYYLLVVNFLILNTLSAQSINQLIHYSIKKHHSLESIKYRLQAMDDRIEKSQKWANPDLSLTINDIQFRKPLSRDEERMQYQAIHFKQKFPWFGKLAARKTLAKENKHVALHSLEAAQVQLAYKIRMTSYTIKELQARIHILKKYVRLAKGNIKLYTDDIATDDMSHTGSVEAELTLSKIEIRLERYKSNYQSQKEKLNYLVQKKVKNISNTLRMKKPKSLEFYLAGVRKNPAYHMKLAQSDAALANKALVDLEKHPDPYVQASYVNRTDFPDFASVTVGVSLPLYGTEEINSEIAKKEALARKSEYIDYKYLIKSDIRESYTRLKEAYRIYHIIQNKSLPQLKHMLELSSTAIEKGGDLFDYTKILEQKLALEEERITIMAAYMRTEAKLKSLTGVK